MEYGSAAVEAGGWVDVPGALLAELVGDGAAGLDGDPGFGDGDGDAAGVDWLGESAGEPAGEEESAGSASTPAGTTVVAIVTVTSGDAHSELHADSTTADKAATATVRAQRRLSRSILMFVLPRCCGAFSRSVTATDLIKTPIPVRGCVSR